MSKPEIEGAARLFQLLDGLPEKLVSRCERKVFKDTMASKYVAMAKAAAPVNEGWLQQSITSKVTRSKKYGLRLRIGIGSVGTKIGTGKKGYDRPWYGRLIETGYMLTTKKPGHKQVRHVPARPFLTPALEVASQEAPKIFKDQLFDEVKLAARKYAKKWVKNS